MSQDGQENLFNEHGGKVYDPVEDFLTQTDDPNIVLETITNRETYLSAKHPEKATGKPSVTKPLKYSNLTKPTKSYSIYSDTTRESFIDRMLEQPQECVLVAKVARELNVKYRTALNWWHIYEETEGVPYKNNEKNSGPKSSFTTEHNEYITKLLDNDPQIFADDIINSLTEQFEGFTFLFLSSVDVVLFNQAQLVEFLNIKYLPFGVDNSDQYEPKSLSFNEIFSYILKITNVLDDRTVNGFTKWCTYKKLKLMEATSKRRMNEAGQKVATRLLYTLKDKFVEATLGDIVMYLPKYQDSLRKMKEAGYEIIGYARKSKGEKDDMKRVFLLNLMVEKLKTRSLADRVFISPNSFAGDPFNKRDENKREELMSHIIANEDTQVILVTIDYAGLTTNCEDMKSFLSDYYIIDDESEEQMEDVAYQYGDIEMIIDFDSPTEILPRQMKPDGTR
ncbi:hypothetical protein MFLAVUS_000398 [Mucor flavus]|uniref:Homeodomain-like DNA binding domain-containing transcription factor n=1 Tax=Mucor flavus TaxID=439312 RepID=A0ABP9YJN0_9FUNG